MILSDREILAALDSGQIHIDPRPDPSLWSSTAIDLTLDAGLMKWKARDPGLGLRPSADGFNITRLMRDPDHAAILTIGPDGYRLEPGSFVLGYTAERVYLPNRSRVAARVEGKSSLARLGVGVHVTAPTIHAGFGHNPNLGPGRQPGLRVQLEIFHLGDQVVILDRGMPICQLILEEVRETPGRGYLGRFSDQEGFTETT